MNCKRLHYFCQVFWVEAFSFPENSGRLAVNSHISSSLWQDAREGGKIVYNFDGKSSWNMLYFRKTFTMLLKQKYRPMRLGKPRPNSSCNALPTPIMPRTGGPEREVTGTRIKCPSTANGRITSHTTVTMA